MSRLTLGGIRDGLLAPGQQLWARAFLAHQRARMRRAWQSPHPPHFSSFRWIVADWAYGDLSGGSLNRAFFAAELLRPTDRVLDIGCGDGFAAGRFFAERCAHVDAVDIEADAIATARRENEAPNVAYFLLDAVADPFPAPPYDVIVWDGAIGHFSPETTSSMVAKIRDALAPDGVFAGSESLGRSEGAQDHLTWFDSVDDLARLLLPSFPGVLLREATYPVPGAIRREGYWRSSARTGWTVAASGFGESTLSG